MLASLFRPSTLLNLVATLCYVHSMYKAPSPYIQANTDIQPNLDLLVSKVGITSYLLGDYDLFDLVSLNIACRRPTCMGGAMMSIVTKQAVKQSPIFVRIVRQVIP